MKNSVIELSVRELRDCIQLVIKEVISVRGFKVDVHKQWSKLSGKDIGKIHRLGYEL